MTQTSPNADKVRNNTGSTSNQTKLYEFDFGKNQDEMKKVKEGTSLNSSAVLDNQIIE